MARIKVFNTNTQSWVYADKSFGKDGESITITNITESSEDKGNNVVTFSDGNILNITNGSKGDKGDKPEKGIDYWTDADQEAMVQQVIIALGTPVFGRVDAENNIILTGELADGTYTLKYEDAEGNMTVIGTLEQGASYTNLADPSSSDWLTDKRYSSDGSLKDSKPAVTTNYIPVTLIDVVRVRYMDIYYHGTGTGYAQTVFFDTNKNRIAWIAPADNTAIFTKDVDSLGRSFNVSTAANAATLVSGSLDDICYVRFSGRLYDGYTKDDVIITVNQEIKE